MKKILYLFILFDFTVPNNIVAQTNKNDIIYGSFSAGVGLFLYKSMPGQMQVTFPYTITDQNGNKTNNIFTSKSINMINNQQIPAGFVNMEFGYPKYFIDLKYFLAQYYNGYSVGCGLNFYLNLLNESNEGKFYEKGILFRPSINFASNKYVGAYDNSNDFGDIDNKNKTINLLGYTSDSTYTYVTGKWPFHTINTATVNDLDITFVQRDFFITPNISLCSNPYRHYFHWELDIAYNLLIGEKSGLELLQNGDNQLESSNIVRLNSGKYFTTFNNNTITSTPLKLNKIFIGLTVGVNISSMLDSKQHHHRPIN
jgi:hypothetical protein